MFWQSKRKNKKAGSFRELTPISNNKLLPLLNVPNPTRSLLWITHEDISKIVSPMTITVTLSLTDSGAFLDTDDHHNFFGEPSLIWTKLDVKKNNEQEENSMYYPAYPQLSQKQRYQYLSWLRDVTQQTNLSYVFLYYYGLERHLLIGKFDDAVEEILRLLKYHDRGTFRHYATEALIFASVYRNRFDFFEKAPHVLEKTTNETLIVKFRTGRKLTAKDILNISYDIGFRNKRYVKMHPKKFKRILQKNIDTYEQKKGDILQALNENKLRFKEVLAFANYSIPEKYRSGKVFDIVGDERFAFICNTLLQQTHDEIKQLKKKREL